MAFVKLLITGDATDEVQLEASLVLTGDVTVSGSGKSLTANDFRLGAIANIQISTGDVTQTGSYHSIEVETPASPDQLDGITAGSDGQLLFIRPQDDTETVTVAHNQHAAATNNILLNGGTSYAMDQIDDYLTLIYDAGQDTNGAWVEVSRGAGNVATLTSTAPTDVGTTAAVGDGSEAARDNHVHDTAAGFIDNADKFASGVVDAAAIGSAAVAKEEIDQTATDIEFKQIIFLPNSNGTGTATGTVYYDTEDARLYVFQA